MQAYEYNNHDSYAYINGHIERYALPKPRMAFKVAMCSQASAAEKDKEKNKYDASLRRLCTPKPSSGKLEVSPEVYKQWKQGGSQRKALLDILIKANGNKDFG